MATKPEIISAIMEGNTQVKQTIAGLSDAQAQTRVGDDGWTIKQVLSHMAGRKPTYERLIAVAQGKPLDYGTNLDPDARNDAMVVTRQDHSLADILAEFLDVHEWAITQVQALPDAALALPVTIGQREIALGDLLERATGTHSVSHIKEVRQALSKA